MEEKVLNLAEKFFSQLYEMCKAMMDFLTRVYFSFLFFFFLDVIEERRGAGLGGAQMRNIPKLEKISDEQKR